MQHGSRLWQTEWFRGTGRTIAGRRGGAHRTCPVCGAGMAELDRLMEDEVLHVWCACTQPGCAGQAVGKKSLRMPRA